MVIGLPKMTATKKICTDCLMAKQVRKPFSNKSTYTSNKVLQLVRIDLCGPIMPETPSVNKYFFLLVDDFSRALWVYMLKNKSEAFDVFKKFQVLVEDRLDRKIKVLSSERGGEFMSKYFISHCEELGIERHFSAPDTPKQNGVVERINRTVVETT